MAARKNTTTILLLVVVCFIVQLNAVVHAAIGTNVIITIAGGTIGAKPDNKPRKVIGSNN